MHPFFYDFKKSTNITQFFTAVASNLRLFAAAFLSAFLAQAGYCQDRYEKISGVHLAAMPFNAHALQYSMRDHHQQQILYSQQEGLGFQKNYQGAAAARKMLQMALKGAWISYKDDAVTYFLSRNEPELEELPEPSGLEAGLMLLKDSLSYRVRVSSSKLHLNVSYNF